MKRPVTPVTHATPFVMALMLSVVIAFAGQAEDVIAKFRTSWEGNSSYQVLMAYHQVKGAKTEDRIVRFSYKSPGWVRTDVLEGKEEGGVAVYDPLEDKVYARHPWMPVPLTFSPDASRVRSLRGERIYDASFPRLIASIYKQLDLGGVYWIGEESVDGSTCTVIEFKNTTPEENRGIARERWWFDTDTGFPRKITSYDKEDVLVQQVIFKALRLNPGFSSDHFNI
ncbi:outer membrane lipoprotein carrier protein LolA [candidate division WOR-3 bacterium]|nr:outer membrane lipoprotein carrier protein LolA [candidate division WOR-3 bacterium]